MKKILMIAGAACLLVVGATFTSSAQLRFNDAASWRIGIAAVGGVPVGSFDDVTDFGVGGMASLSYMVDPMFSLSLKSGYMRFSGADIQTTNTDGAVVTVSGPDMNVVPILVGGTYHLSPDAATQLYLGADVGPYLLSAENGGETTTRFGVGPSLGLQFRMSDAVNLNLNGNYTTVFTENETTSWAGFGAGLMFVLGR
jgi:opacity protein-like surface antigen